MYLKTLPFNSTLFKKDLKMIMPIIIIVAIIMLFATTLPITTAYQRYKDEVAFFEKEGYEYNKDEMLENCIYDVNYRLNNGNEFYPIAIVVPIVVAAILFGEEKRRKTFEVLSTMPFTRYEIFYNKLLVALVATVFPFIINGLIMLLGVALSSNLRMFYSAAQVLKWLIKYIYYQLPFLSFAFLFGTLTGTTIAQFILTVIFLIFPMGFTYMLLANISGWVRSGFWRLSGFADGIWDKVIEYSIYGVFDSSYKGANRYIYYIILSIVLIIVSKILFDKNKIERSGETLEFENIETFFKVGVAVCTALLMGLIFVWIFEGIFYRAVQYYRIVLIFGYVVGGLLGWYLSKLSIKSNRIKE